jgi:hypothetical protein
MHTRVRVEQGNTIRMNRSFLFIFGAPSPGHISYVTLGMSPDSREGFVDPGSLSVNLSL